MLENSIKYLEKIIFFIIKGVIFLLPWFFLPWTSEYFEFNKQFLLWLFVPLAALLWLYQMASRARLKIKTNPLNWPVLIFLLLLAASAWFSLDRFSSFFGYFGSFSQAWLGFLSLVVFYFLIVNTRVADSAKKITALLKLLLYAAVVVAVVSLVAMAGGWAAISGAPLSIFSSASFNLAGGSLLSLAVFLALMAMATAGLLTDGGLKKIESVIFSAGLFMFLLVLALVDFSLSWALLLVGAVLMLLFRGLVQGFNFRKWSLRFWLIPAVLLALAVLMLAAPKINLAKMVLGQDLPREALLNQTQSWLIAKESLKKNPFLGSGPGAWAQDFSLYRPAEFNQSAFWQIRFDKSGSQISEILATGGLLTFLSYFLIICLALYLNLVLIKKYLTERPARLAWPASPRLRPGGPGLERNSSAGEPAPGADYNLVMILIMIFVLAAGAQFFFAFNTVLNFIFWLALALTMAFWQQSNRLLFKDKVAALNGRAWLARLWPLFLFIIAVAVFALLAFEVKFFLADLMAARRPATEAGLKTAVKLNPDRFNYQLNLAKFYLNQARAQALKPLAQRDNLKVRASVSQAIEMARAAAALAPNSVLAQESLGMIYRDSRPFTLGGEAWAARAFSRALALEPTNPVLASELAKAYLNDNNLLAAEKYFIQALNLKADYDEAKFGLARTYLNLKKDNQALILLKELAREVGAPEVHYELGRFYYNHGEIDKAVDRFKLVLSLFPRHANSLYSLAAAYEAKGDFKQALKYYRQVIELNPGNGEVIKKIKELSK